MGDFKAKDLCIILEDNLNFFGGIVLFHESDYGGAIAGLKAKLRYDAYEGNLFILAMQQVSEFLFAYNNGLCKHKDEIPKEIFALRFFEKFSRVQPMADRFVPKKSKRTKEILKGLSDTYNVGGSYHGYSMIFVDEETKREAWNNTKHRVTINISSGVIETWGLSKSVHPREYEKIKGKPPKDLPNSDLYNSSIRINQIADYIDEVKNSPDGFITNPAMPNDITILR